jgi:ribokinase
VGRIVVVGCYIVGLSMFVERIPGAGETVRGRDFAEGPGGKGSNQAIAAARLGGDVAFLGCVGRDRFGDDGAACLRREGVDIGHLGRVDQPTATGFIVIDAEARNAISITEDASGALDDRRVDAAADELLDDASVLLAQWEMPLAPIRRAVALAHERDVRTIWNPAPGGPLSEPLAGLDLLTPNESEARTLAGLDPQADVNEDELGRLLRERLGCDIVLTLGERGALIVDGRQPRHVPTPTVDAVDTTGAGDAFNAALAVALAGGDGLDEAVHLACAAGAYSVLTAGTVASYPTRAELHTFMRART